MAYYSAMNLSPRCAPPRRERGASLLGVLLALIILGVMAAVAVSAVGGTGGNAPATTPLETATSTGEPNNVASAAALATTCVADFASLSTALQIYATLHGSNPPAGTSWVTGIQSRPTLLQSWPSDPGHFIFTWNGTVLGVVPRHGVSSTATAGSASSSNGCYASLG